MKLAACLFVSCLIFGSISAGIIPTKHIGDIDNQNKYENKIVQLPVGTDSVEFTFPEVASDRRIVGIEEFYFRPNTHVEYLSGGVGHQQVSIRVTNTIPQVDAGISFHIHFDQ